MAKDEQNTAGTRRFFMMVGGSILVASSLVAISMNWYRTGSTINTDLSLPKYQQYREKIDDMPLSQNFASYGPLDKKTLDVFKKAYSDELQAIGGVDYFTNEPVSDSALGIDVR